MEQEVLKYLSDKYPVSQTDEINEQLNDELSKWKTSVHRKLKIDNPFFENQNRFVESKESFNKKVFDVTSLSNDFNGYSELSKISNCNLDEDFWKKEIAKFEAIEKLEKSLATKKSQTTSDLKISRKLLLQKWEKSLIKEHSKWELSEIEKYRQEILKKLENWLELLQRFQDLMKELSFDTGLLFDLSQGSITLNDINQLKKWAEYISKNEGLKKLCDMLGRLRNIEKSTKQEIINVRTHIEETIKDYT